MSVGESTRESPGGRWHFSLRALLVAIVIICAVIGYIVLGRDLYQTRQELRTLRAETGHLSIDDRSQLHAIAVEVAEPKTWRWRLFIPKGHQYSWNIACEDIPKDEPPSGPSITGMSNEPYWERDNEVLVTAKLRPVSDDEWLLSVESRIGERHREEAPVLRRTTRWLPGFADLRPAGYSSCRSERVTSSSCSAVMKAARASAKSNGFPHGGA